MRLRDLNDPGNDPVQRRLFFPVALVGSVIFNRNGIGQNIICQYLSVSVIDLPSRAGNIDLFFDPHGEAFRIIFTMDDLEQKYPSQQNTVEKQNDQHQDEDSGSYKIDKRLFKIIKQSIHLSGLFIKSSVYSVNQPVKKQRHNNRIQKLRQYDPRQIIEKCKAASHHEHDHIMPKSVRQLAGRYQKDREFDIFSIKNMVEISVCVAYVHIDHRMHSQKSSIKDIFQKPAEKAHPKPFLFPFHKAERRRYDYHQIRTDGTDGQGLEYGTLKQESNQYDQYGHNPALHF